MKFVRNSEAIKEKLVSNIKLNEANYLSVSMNKNSNRDFSKILADLDCHFVLDQIKHVLILENYQVGSESIENIDNFY